MESAYDENLNKNAFFAFLQRDYRELVDSCPLQKLIVLVPRQGSLQRTTFDEEFLHSHILIPSDELPETQFYTLNGRAVKRLDRKLRCEVGKGGRIESLILFEEICYTKDHLKYKLWCLDRPLDVNRTTDSGTGSGLIEVNSLKTAIELIWSEVQGRNVLRKIDLSIGNFMKNNRRISDLGKWKRNLLLLYNHSMDIVLMNRKLRERCRTDAFLLKNLKVGVETYLLNGIYEHLFETITNARLEENEELNKAIRRASDLSFSDLHAEPMCKNFIPAMKLELLKIDEATTVVGKLSCLKRAFNVITERHNQQTNNNKLLTTDDLLQILVFAIVKSGVRHWISHHVFLKDFALATDQNGADSYLVTTLEAAITYIQSTDLRPPPCPLPVEKKSRFGSKEEYLGHLFAAIRVEDEAEVLRLLRPSDKAELFTHLPALCHPLCSCPECEAKIADSTPTVDSRDAEGRSALLVAVEMGLPRMVTLLLSFGAAVDQKGENWETPLQLAASRGHQNSLFLLMHAGADPNEANADLNTPLHLACLHGHENCTKALLYFSEQMHIKLSLNAANKQGDTPLHVASRWGFIGMVDALLEHGALSDQSNKFNQTPIDVAHNSRIRTLLKSSFVMVDGGAVFESSGRVHLTDEDLADDEGQTTVTNMAKIERIFAAIAAGDTPLACHHLGIDERLTSTSPGNCHPLCACKICSAAGTTTPKKEAKVTFDLNSADPEGNTPLHAAARVGNTALVEILLRNNARSELKNRAGQTAVHVAVRARKWQVIQVLLSLSKGRLVDLKDNDGDTALHCAVRADDAKMVELLLRFEPALELRNNEGLKARELAWERRAMGIVALLENAEKQFASHD